jgi:hypothetical protein
MRKTIPTQWWMITHKSVGKWKCEASAKSPLKSCQRKKQEPWVAQTWEPLIVEATLLQSLSPPAKLNLDQMDLALPSKFKGNLTCIKLKSTEDKECPSTRIRSMTPRPITRLKSNCNKK